MMMMMDTLVSGFNGNIHSVLSWLFELDVLYRQVVSLFLTRKDFELEMALEFYQIDFEGIC